MNIVKYNSNNSIKFVVILLVSLLTVGGLTGCGSSEKTKKSSKSSASNKKKTGESSKEDKKEETKESAEKEGEKGTHADVTDKKETGDKQAKKEEKKAEKKDLSHASAPAADAIWADLMKGNRRFISGNSQERMLVAERHELVKGQHPKVVILGCADSRLSPELIFDKSLGDLFVVRTAGNVADPVALGSMEYAVEHLHASVLVVLGHESCGAVAAALTGEKMPSSNLTSIVEKIRPAFEGSAACALGSKGGEECIELNVSKSASDVLAKSSILRKAVEEGQLTVIRAVYHLESGEVKKLN